jgi:hypothetical protein
LDNLLGTRGCREALALKLLAMVVATELAVD